MTPGWSNRACHWNRQGRRKRDGFFLVPKLLLRHAIVFEAPLRRRAAGGCVPPCAGLSKQSFADKCAPK